jgi:hypothetical protein
MDFSSCLDKNSNAPHDLPLSIASNSKRRTVTILLYMYIPNSNNERAKRLRQATPRAAALPIVLILQQHLLLPRRCE